MKKKLKKIKLIPTLLLLGVKWAILTETNREKTSNGERIPQKTTKLPAE